MDGQYDQNYPVGEDGMPISQEQYEMMLQQQQQDYGGEMDQYGQEDMGQYQQ